MDEKVEFSSIERKLFDRAAEKRLPAYVGFELTPYCNLSCKMCNVKENAPGLPVLDSDAWLDVARQAADLGTLVVQISGGEPMVHPEFKKIYSGIKKLGLVVTMNSNGTRIDESMADFLAEDMPRRMNISLYGPNREVYDKLCGNPMAFDQTIRGIELLLERKIPVKINLTPNTINYPYLDEILEICKAYHLVIGMTTYMFEPLRKCGAEKQLYRLNAPQMAIAMEKWDRYMNNEKQMTLRAKFCQMALEHFDESRQTPGVVPLRCRAATSSAWVCWDGKMNACVDMIQPRADIRELGFAGAWEKVKEYGETIRVPAKCSTCSLRMLCLNCGAINFHENGTFERAPQIMCDATEAYARNLAKALRSAEKKETEES